MDTDLILVIGLILGLLAIPGIMSSVSENRAPRAPILTILIAAGMITFAFVTHPGGYTLEEIPDVFYRVVGKYFG